MAMALEVVRAQTVQARVQVPPLRLGGTGLGDHLPRRGRRQEPVGVLDEHAGPETPELANQRLGGGGRQQPGGLALRGQLGQRRLVVGRGDDQVGLGSGGDGFGHLRCDRSPDGHDPAEGRLGIALEGPLVGGHQVGVDGRPARVGVLDDGHGTLGAARLGQLVDQAPRRVGIEDVEIGELLAPVLDHVVPPRVAPDDPVAGTVLVGVLPVAQRAGPLEGQVDGGRQDGVDRQPTSVRSRASSNQSTMAAS